MIIKQKPGNGSNVAALSILTGWDATALLQKGDSLCRMVAWPFTKVGEQSSVAFYLYA